MAEEVELISDGEGVAVIGDAELVDRFLAAEGLESRDLGLERVGSILGKASPVAQAGSAIAGSSGRWVKLTQESAESMKKFGLMETKTRGVSHAMIGKPGNVKKWMQIDARPSSMLTNPALLSGAAGVMAQLALQQAMDEITTYLAAIDQKVDDILRAQKDSVVADMIGVDLVISEAMNVRDSVGTVSDMTWSKVQAAPAIIARTQAYAVRQLDAIAEKLEKAKIGDLAKVAKSGEADAKDWLAVLAHCFSLQDAVWVLELERVLVTNPETLDNHRLGLKASRGDRAQKITRCTEHLLARMAVAIESANSKVLLHPRATASVVQSCNNAIAAAADFQNRLGFGTDQNLVDARRWSDAASEAKDKAADVVSDAKEKLANAGSLGVGGALRLGSGMNKHFKSKVLRRSGS